VPELLTATDPAPLAVVATVDPDGAPHAVPLWFRWDGGAVLIWTGARRHWVRNLAHEDRVAVTVAVDREPYPGLIIRGTATVHGDGSTTHPDDPVDAEIVAITRRYIPPEDVDAYIAGWPELRTIVRIVPDRLHAWGTADADELPITS
jgi:PPOX class probable F420-dependent enzyme